MRKAVLYGKPQKNYLFNGSAIKEGVGGKGLNVYCQLKKKLFMASIAKYQKCYKYNPLFELYQIEKHNATLSVFCKDFARIYFTRCTSAA